jgi:hypothetical protein
MRPWTAGRSLGKIGALKPYLIPTDCQPMQFPRRYILRLAASALALPAFAEIAHAQKYPSRPVRILV